jgi:homoaconitase/3-isopropylmalate dehydratase large subunit
MGKTITEKIIERAAGKKIHTGEFVRISLGNLVLGSLPVKELEELGVKKVFDPQKIKIVLGGHDYCLPHNLKMRRSTMQTAKELGIPRGNIMDIGEGGEEHDVSIEHGWPLPGTVYLCGIDGQTPMNGALGCVAEPLAHGANEIVAATITGKSWIHVPPSIKINLAGTLQKGVTARDVSEYVLGKIGSSGALGSMIEWSGPAIGEMSLAGRIAICCHSAFTGAFSGIVNPDQKTIDFVKSRTEDTFDPVTSDADATYEKTLNFDVSSIEPQVGIPPKRHIVKSIKDVEGKKVDRGFIGSCANGRLEDLQIAAKILKGRKVHPDVHLNITPNSTENYKLALREGLIETFIEAGALVPAPCCGMCLGYVTPLVGDEVCVSTSTCNYSGRMGSEEADIYLASPATVAASCVEGKFADPRRFV